MSAELHQHDTNGCVHTPCSADLNRRMIEVLAKMGPMWDYIDGKWVRHLDSSYLSRLLWVTNHPKSLKGMWPRRIGAVYIEGPPKATTVHTTDELARQGLVGAYVDMNEAEYRNLPLARTPAELKPNS